MDRANRRAVAVAGVLAGHGIARKHGVNDLHAAAVPGEKQRAAGSDAIARRRGVPRKPAMAEDDVRRGDERRRAAERRLGRTSLRGVVYELALLERAIDRTVTVGGATVRHIVQINADIRDGSRLVRPENAAQMRRLAEGEPADDDIARVRKPCQHILHPLGRLDYRTRRAVQHNVAQPLQRHRLGQRIRSCREVHGRARQNPCKDVVHIRRRFVLGLPTARAVRGEIGVARNTGRNRDRREPH